MNTITQDMRFKQAVIEYSLKHGVTKAAIRYKTSRQNIYRWRKKFNGTVRSLADGSHRPHSHPNQHTEEDHSCQKYAPPKPACGFGGLLGEAAPARIYPFYLWSVPSPAPDRRKTHQATQPEIHPQAIRTNDLSGAKSAD